MGSYVPAVPGQWSDDDGAPAAAHLLFTYEAGTTTKLTTYSDVNLTTPNTNPIVLDAAGRAVIFVSATSYKYVLALPTDSDPPTDPLWTRDNIPAIPVSVGGTGDMTGVAGENLSTNDSVFLSDGSGGNTAGRWYKTDADQTYSSTDAAATGFAPSAITSAASGTIRRTGRLTGMSSLTAGAVYYVSATAGAVTISPPTNARAVGVADTTTSLVILASAPVPTATASVGGIVSAVAQEFGGLKTFTAGLESDIPITFLPPGGAAQISVPGRLTAIYATVGNVGAGEDDLMSYTLPASTLTTNGMAVKVFAWGSTTSNANTKTLKAYFGSTQVFGGSGALLTASEAGSWVAGYTVIRTAAATQRAAAQVVCGPAGSTITASVGGVTTPGETLTNTVAIKFTGTATSDNDITQAGMIVMLVV